MRFASLFQRRTESRGARAAALCAGVGAGLFWAGCFFELADVTLPGTGGAGNGGVPVFSGAGGEAGAGAPTGGLGGAGSPSSCMPGFKDCGAGCEPFSVANGCAAASCTPCAALPQASLACDADSGQCEVAECAAGFADCDGDTLSYSGEAGGNGCEYALAPAEDARPAPDLLEVPLADIDIADGERNDWAGVPAYPLLETCDNCSDPSLPDVTAKNEVPPRDDLEAFFRVAWDADFFFVLGDVFDANLVSDGAARNDGRCQNGALCEDALTIFVDGRNDRATSSSYNIDDFQLYLGLAGKAFRVSGAPVSSEQVDFKVTPVGAACYRVEAQLSWDFMTGVTDGTPVLPEVGQELGFDISVNDWDPGVSDETPRRESQLFWIDPGDGYHQETTGFGPMRLVETVSPAEPPQ